MKSDDKGPVRGLHLGSRCGVGDCFHGALRRCQRAHTETVLQQMFGVGRWARSNIAAYVFARAIPKLS